MQRWKNTTIDRLSIKKFFNNAGTYIVLILAVGGLTFFGIFPPQGDQGSLSGTAAEVGDLRITSNDFRSAYQNTYQTYQNQYGQDFDPAQLNLSEVVLNQLVDRAALYLAARALGVQASEENVIDYLTGIDAFRDKDGKFSERYYASFLRSNRYSEEVFMSNMVRDLTLSQLRRFVTNFVFVSRGEAELDYRLANSHLDVEFIKIEGKKLNITVSDADVDAYLQSEEGKQASKTYYDEHPSEFKQTEQVHAQHILIAYKEARNASGDAKNRNKAEAQKLAAKVHKLALTGDFSALAQQYSDEPLAKERKGDLGFFTREDMATPFSKAAFALAKGAISAVTETDFGFHVIKVLDKKAAVEKDFDTAQQEIATKLLKKERGPEFAAQLAQDWLQKLNATTDISKELAAQGLKLETTGKFSLSAGYVPKLGSDTELRDLVYGLSTDRYALHEQRGDFYLLKLKAKTIAEAKNFKDERSDNEYLRFYRGNTLYTWLEKNARKDLEARNEISMNNAFLHFDRQRAAANAAAQTDES